MKLLVVSVGTDHHPFNRLVGWIEKWAQDHSEVRVVVQHGTSNPAAGCENHQMLPHPELMSLFQEADAVLLQGGPGGVMDARSSGITPIVVPRDPALGEHVDGHQIHFSHHLSRSGTAFVVRSQQDLVESLDATHAGDRVWRIDRDAVVPSGVTAVAEHLSQLPARRVRRLRRIWSTT